MKIETINNVEYKLPSSLNEFQKELYVHLINFKWKYITKEVGLSNYKGKSIEYDAILPKSVASKFPIIYPFILKDLNEHLKTYPFKFHNHFNHMASSQAANVNLFLPILLSPNANAIFSKLKPDFKELAVSKLHKGFRIEYWDGNSNQEKGLLGDHNARSGTDCDIAIAYYNHSNKLCLWLIEHKLAEKEFTKCGGSKSNARDKTKHLCSKSFNDILENKDYCFYHNFRKNNYWNITESHKNFFINNHRDESCPFQNGMNQLWRNQLLGFALEDDETNEFEEVFFSVVHHPDNHSIDDSIKEYKNLVGDSLKFSSFTSKVVIEKAQTVEDIKIKNWVKWYKELYKV